MFRRFAFLANIQVFLAGVKLRDDQSRLRHILEKCSKSELLKWHDGKGLDLLHHVIILNNAEAVQLLFSLGYFLPPYEPLTASYAHLAAFLGHGAILGLVLQFRPFDNRQKSLEDKNNNFFRGLGNGSMYPADVAGKTGHVECVKLIMDLCILKENPDLKTGYLTLACVADCPYGLRLLCEEECGSSDIKTAVEKCIIQPRPECLDILLLKFTKLPVLFSGINLFHVLFSQRWKYTPTGVSNNGYESLVKLTDVLIKHKYDVNTRLPLHTYPLYTLLRNSLAILDFSETKYYIQCLCMLLQAGADPNFDEVKFERVQRKRGTTIFDNRPLYSSALHCLMDTVEMHASTLESKALAVKFIMDCSKLLLAHQANTNAIGILGTEQRFAGAQGTVLHQFAKTSVEIGVDTNILRLLLRHGIDVDKKVSNKYAINTYVDALTNKITRNKQYTIEQNYLEDIEQFLLILKFMSPPAIADTLRLLEQQYIQNDDTEIQRHFNYVTKKIKSVLKKVSPLKRLCINRIWILIGRKASNVALLPVNVELKTCILPNT